MALSSPREDLNCVTTEITTPPVVHSSSGALEVIEGGFLVAHEDLSNGPHPDLGSQPVQLTNERIIYNCGNLSTNSGVEFTNYSDLFNSSDTTGTDSAYNFYEVRKLDL